jgi:hypothetical protein
VTDTKMPDRGTIEYEIYEIETRVEGYQSDSVAALREARNVIRSELFDAKGRRDSLREQADRFAALADRLEVRFKAIEQMIMDIDHVLERGE